MPSKPTAPIYIPPTMWRATSTTVTNNNHISNEDKLPAIALIIIIPLIVWIIFKQQDNGK
jgi:hypothetical protein